MEIRWSSAAQFLRRALNRYRAGRPPAHAGGVGENLCNLLITEFLANDPVQTFAPIRRAGEWPRRMRGQDRTRDR